MNKDNAKDYLPLVQALAEGKVIQHRSHISGKWGDVVRTNFPDEPDCYRIKPEPRRAWVWWPPAGIDAAAVAFISEVIAEDVVCRHGGHITEVTE